MVALVVTIIILLILAGIVITLAVGDNGIITRAKKAADIYKELEEKEGKELNNLYTQLASINNGNSNVDIEDINKIVESLKTDIISSIYPVGSIYISENERNPAEFIGGKWESYGQGKTLVGVGKGTDSNSEQKTFNINEEGGEYKHTLSIEEMPSHNGHIYTDPRGKGDSAYYININNATISGTANANGWRICYNNELYPVSYNIGDSQEHNNIQPYITVYMWKRVE